nr:hypothetical protein KitaXyl93_02880 [Kitasatospora sp. Xyl93]
MPTALDALEDEPHPTITVPDPWHRPQGDQKVWTLGTMLPSSSSSTVASVFWVPPDPPQPEQD